MCARAPRDLVSLRRRARDVAEQFGLEERIVQSFSAATYEAARLLFERGDTAAANISIGASGDLEVTICVSDRVHDPLAPEVSESLSRLNAVVERFAIEHCDGSTTITLATALPLERRPQPAASPIVAGAEPPAVTAAEDVVEENIRLRRTIGELQSELDETNRSIVALFAEADGHAEKVREATSIASRRGTAR